MMSDSPAPDRVSWNEEVLELPEPRVTVPPVAVEDSETAPDALALRVVELLLVSVMPPDKLLKVKLGELIIEPSTVRVEVLVKLTDVALRAFGEVSEARERVPALRVMVPAFTLSPIETTPAPEMLKLPEVLITFAVEIPNPKLSVRLTLLNVEPPELKLKAPLTAVMEREPVVLADTELLIAVKVMSPDPLLAEIELDPETSPEPVCVIFPVVSATRLSKPPALKLLLKLMLPPF